MAKRTRIGQTVRILGGMEPFVGELGRIIDLEQHNPPMYRVKLHRPVHVTGVGFVTDDLWEGRLLRTISTRGN